MSFELSRLGTSSTDVLSTTSLAPVLDEGSSATSLTGLGRSSQSLLFVDRSVADYQQLVAGATPGTEIHVLDPAQDAVTQITNILLGRQNIASLHVVSHGEAGGLDFGNSALNLIDLPQYAAQLKTWSKALTNDADILFYGCNVAEGAVGQRFVQSISQLTGADVAASDDLTGSAALGGNWNLEYHTGPLETSIAFSSSASNHYTGVLAYTLGARSAVGASGDVFLGGQFIELGINKSGGYFGTSDTKPANFFGTSARSQIGLSIDPDGYQTGNAFSYDVFLPGTPLEGFALGYTLGGTNYSYENSGGTGLVQLSNTSVVNTSSGNTLSAVVTSTTAQNIVLTQTYSFDYTKDYWSTVLNVRNNSGSAISNLRYLRYYDPDIAVDAGGSNTTTNTVLNSTSADGKVVIETKVPSSDSTFATYGARPAYFASTDPTARGFIGSYFFLSDVAGGINGLAETAKGTTLTADSSIGIWFDVGAVSAGASKTFNYASGLSSNVISAISSDSPPTIATNALSITEGATVVLSGSNLSAVDSDNTSAQLTYTVSGTPNGRFELVSAPGTAITGFTQAQVNAGAIQFVHDGGENPPAYSLIVNDGLVSSTSSNVTIGTFTNVNDAPTISTNTLSLSEGGSVVLSSSNINATDPDNTAAQLTYTASSINGGQFELVANAGVAITSFTQAQINSGTVRFIHGGGETAPSYSLIANDGSLNSGSSTVSIGTFTNVNDAPTLSGNATLTAVAQNTTNPSGSTITNLFGSLFSDPDTGASLSGLAIIGNTANSTTQGQWQYSIDGTTWASVGTVADGATALALSASTLVRFVPVTGYNGTPPDLTVRALDNSYNGGFTTATTLVQVNTTSNGGTTAIAGTTVALNTNVRSLSDLLWHNSSTGQNAVWQLDGFTLQSAYFLPTVTDRNWQIASTADFNHDGIADILWRNQASGENVIWQMNSTGYESSHFITQVPDQNWQIFSTADFNSDGTPDILWRNKATGENSIWEMKSDFTLQAGHFITQVPDQNWQIVSTADFNSNGTPDILWRNKATGENSIWEMKSDFTLQAGHFITQVPDANWQIAGTNDFNHDGTPDILWRNKQAAKEDIWQMSGFSYAQRYPLVDAIDPNWSVRPFVARLTDLLA